MPSYYIEETEPDYTIEEIVPIPAYCPKCKYQYVGVDAVKAPSLSNCYCFHCITTKLRKHPDYPGIVDATTRRKQKTAEGTVGDA